MPVSDLQSLSSVLIVPGVTQPLSKEQKAFNSLIKKIEARRAALLEWESTLPAFHQKYASDLLPLQQQYLDLQWQFAQALDLTHAAKGLTKTEKRKVAVLITDIARGVLEQQENDELKALFNKYSDWDFDEEEAERLGGMKAMLEDVIGMELGDDVDMTSPEDVLQRMEAQFMAQQEALGEAPPRKKTRREETREAKQMAEEKQMSQSIREVYRKLAGALHPDREPDPVERARKTDLMQRVNQAYEKGNLLQLLALQLELENINPNHLAEIGTERLKHYSKILKGQLSELDLEIESIEAEVMIGFNLPPDIMLRPKNLMVMLQRDVRTCKEQIAGLQEQIGMTTDPRLLKVWLKNYSINRPTYDDFDMPF